MPATRKKIPRKAKKPAVRPPDPKIISTAQSQKKTETPDPPTGSPDNNTAVNPASENTPAPVPEIPAVDINAPLSLDSAPPSQSPSPLEEKNRGLFIGGVLFTLIILAASAGSFVYFYKQESNISEAVPTPASVRPTPAPVFSKSGWTLEVLNGSGVAGAAKTYAEKLSSAGFPVLKIGNATGGSYKKNMLYISPDFLPRTQQFLDIAGSLINIASADGVLTDSTAAARIIVGKK